MSGITLAIGYGIRVLGAWAWNYEGIPQPKPGSAVQKVVVGTTTLLVGFVLLATIWRHVGWQNAVRESFGMDPIHPGVWLPILPVTLLVAALLLILSRSLRKLFQFVERWLARDAATRRPAAGRGRPGGAAGQPCQRRPGQRLLRRRQQRLLDR